MTHPQSARTFRSLVVSGFAWSVASSLVVQLARMVFAVALARFLTPREYGLAAMALVFSALVSVFSDLSLGVGLVQRSRISEEDRSTVFWTSAAVGAALTVAGVAGAGVLASFYGEPEVQPLFAVLSISFAIGSLGATHAALLHREMQFRSISIRIGSSTVIGGAVGVLLAVLGYGAWALIVQQLCVSGISTVLLWRSIPWRPHLRYSIGALRDLGSFGGAIFGVRLLDYARTHADKLLVGRFLGSSPLGTYSVAFNILLGPVSRLMVAISDTVLPAFSRLQDDRPRMAAAWLSVNRAVIVVFAPALIGLALVADDFVRAVLGPRWQAIGPLLQILSVGMLAQALSALGVEVLKAQGRAKMLFRFAIWETVLLLTGIAVAIPWGLWEVAVAYTIVHVATRAYFLWLTCDCLGVPFGRLLVGLRGVAEALLGLSAGVAAMSVTLAGSSPAVRLAATVVAGIVIYVPLCLWRVAGLRSDLRELARDAGMSRRGTGQPS